MLQQSFIDYSQIKIVKSNLWKLNFQAEFFFNSHPWNYGNCFKCCMSLLSHVSCPHIRFQRSVALPAYSCLDIQIQACICLKPFSLSLFLFSQAMAKGQNHQIVRDSQAPQVSFVIFSLLTLFVFTEAAENLCNFAKYKGSTSLEAAEKKLSPLVGKS